MPGRSQRWRVSPIRSLSARPRSRQFQHSGECHSQRWPHRSISRASSALLSRIGNSTAGLRRRFRARCTSSTKGSADPYPSADGRTPGLKSRRAAEATNLAPWRAPWRGSACARDIGGCSGEHRPHGGAIPVSWRALPELPSTRIPGHKPPAPTGWRPDDPHDGRSFGRHCDFQLMNREARAGPGVGAQGSHSAAEPREAAHYFPVPKTDCASFAKSRDLRTARDADSGYPRLKFAMNRR